jgi:hypothetical protein
MARLSKAQKLLAGAQSFFGRAASIITGQSRPLSAETYMGMSTGDASPILRGDDEYPFFPVRNPAMAHKLHALRDQNEASTAVRALVGDMFASENGDDLGFRISPTNPDGSPVDPKIQEIGDAVIARVFKLHTIWSIAQGFLYDGDAFRSILLNEDLTQVEALVELPTWEMFRIQDSVNRVIRFEQRSDISRGEARFSIHPAICVHWRLAPEGKYGKSLFRSIVSVDGFESLNKTVAALGQAAMDLGYNPHVHRLPSAWDRQRCDAYRLNHENSKRTPGYIVTDFYVQEPGDVRTVATGSGSTMVDLVETIQLQRTRIAMCAQVAPWVMGLASEGATDIGGQPALYGGRVIANLRSVFAEGAKQVIRVELACHGIIVKDSDFALVFPKLFTSIIAQSGADPEDPSSAGIVGETAPGNPLKKSGSEKAGGGSMGGSIKPQMKSKRQGKGTSK